MLPCSYGVARKAQHVLVCSMLYKSYKIGHCSVGHEGMWRGDP